MSKLNKIGTLHIIFREEALQNAREIIEGYTEIQVKSIPIGTENWSFREITKVDENLFEEKTVSANYHDDVA